MTLLIIRVEYEVSYISLAVVAVVATTAAIRESTRTFFMMLVLVLVLVLVLMSRLNKL